MKTFCQNCSQKAKKYDLNCSQCGTKLSIPNIPSYTPASIAVMILFFLPTGLIALLYSIQVNNKIKEGKFEEAIKNSKKALLFCWISVLVVILFIIFRLFISSK